MKYTECQKIVKVMLFQKAIAVDDEKKPVSDSINLDAMGKLLLLLLLLLIKIKDYYYKINKLK